MGPKLLVVTNTHDSEALCYFVNSTSLKILERVFDDMVDIDYEVFDIEDIPKFY